MFAFGPLRHLSHINMRILPEESAERKYKRLQKQHAKMAPVPLPQKRPRALTLPLPPDMGIGFARKIQITHEQKQSSFFHLPLEMRRLIYAEVFCDGNPDFIIHILLREKRFGHICGDGLEWAKNRRRFGLSELCANHNAHGDGFLALLRTCRVIYTEAVSLLYSKPTFVFQDPKHIVLFTRTILPNRLATIQTMELAWERGPTLAWAGIASYMTLLDEDDAWREALKVIGGMKGLKEIRLRLNIQETDPLLGPVKLFVQQIRRISGLHLQLILPSERFCQFDDMHDESFNLGPIEEETMLEMQRQLIGTD